MLLRCGVTVSVPGDCAAELRRVRSEGENALARSEREREALAQALSITQLEAQQNLRNAISDHQEELEKLAAEKVRKATATPLYPTLMLATISVAIHLSSV